MKPQKVFFGANIKFLRERRKLSQEALAEQLGLTRSKLNALENGQTKAPQPEDYLKFSDFFKISVDSLLKIDLSRLSELKLRELEAGNDVYMTGSQIRVLAITVDKENRENVEYVPVKAKAGYRSGYADPEYLAALPRFSLPNLPQGHTYRMFPITGDSMLPIPEGSDVVGQYVEDWKSIRPGTPCILILKGDQDFVFKEVTVQPDGGLLLRSYNMLYEPYTVRAEEVLEIWKFHSYQSREIPSAESNMEQLLKLMTLVGREIREMKGMRR
ncbi:XRE family transcriptional regulator [Telluribacter sp.]|jgi:transcriptional regulator with XRE-family HTH domain|uniref:XRE family transcriptional regulator n=1 Tax=Telluribacter sp. TaxID=1978767 RepID=UPI002E13E23A|nr:helix-turn-helix domain-containing protein [Telluribacter sp.]